METFDSLNGIGPRAIWEGVVARDVQGERMTMAVMELAPDAHVPEHRHENEQLGLVLHGSVRMRVANEEREVRAGGTYRILSDTPHEAFAGPEGAVVVDVFSPIRFDWSVFEPEKPSKPLWP